MSRWANILSFLALCTGPILALAQCPPPEAPPPPDVAGQIHDDVGSVFSWLSSDRKSGPAVSTTLFGAGDQDRLIVPGTRAGPFEIGQAREEISGHSTLIKLETTIDPRYKFILPLGYVPPRTFLRHPKQPLTFALGTEDKKVHEIFVRDKTYATSDGIRVGSPESSLRRQNVESVSKDTKGRQYHRAPGITFLVEKTVVIEIVVRRRTKTP